MNDKLEGKPIKKNYQAVLLGDCGVFSKASLLNFVVKGIFDPDTMSTNSASFCSKSFLSKNNEEINFGFWDTTGQQQFISLSINFIIDTDVIILGFDIARYESFKEVKNFWYPNIMEYAGTDLIYLLANKIDLIKEEKVEYKFEEEAKNFAKENNLRYFPISCKTGEGIKEFIDDLVNEVY